ncbi:MFS transporter [Aurantimonas coralicida]|uniref:MFS transporter n=1 Tax=Aurantimonas coralicida TaxID=182270 RepID=UPI002398579A|nr:MFS transporter [Aurantimonas coralicida]MDE0923062.1 MFS transporter [Aurantimonas coralicida]
MTPFIKLSAAGFAATAITFGPARMGFGLFLAEFKSTFSLSTGMAGVISGIGFFGFFLGLLISYAMTARSGPRMPVVSGLFAALVGMAIVAAAPNAWVLAVGVFLATSSAGFSWAPFNNAVHRLVDEARRPATLSMVSTGTSLGVAAAGATALMVSYGELSWRYGWAGFAVVAALALAGNIGALRELAGDPGPPGKGSWKSLIAEPARPLLWIALSFGITTTIYISFAADRIQQAGGLPGIPEGAAPAIVFLSYGIFGLVGLTTGRLKTLIGLPWLLRLLHVAAAAALALIALAPNSWTGVVVSAGLQGAYVMMMSAVMAFWSEELFPSMPSLSFTEALLAVAVGSVVGPLVAGFASSAFGPEAMFLGAAGIAAVTAASILPRMIRERWPQEASAGGGAMRRRSA